MNSNGFSLGNDRGRNGNRSERDCNREPSNHWKMRRSVGSDWSRCVGRNRGRAVDRLRVINVFNVGDIAGVSVGNVVGDDLSATVGQVDAVFAVGRVPVASLVVAEVSTPVVSITLHSVTKFINWRSVMVGGSMAISGSGGICWGGVIR